MKSPSNNPNQKHKNANKSAVEPLADHLSKDDQNISILVNAALTQSADKLPEQVLIDLAQIRKNALAELKPVEQSFSLNTNSITSVLSRYFSVSGLKITAPLALALVVTVSFRISQVETIPTLPSAMINLDIPSEDLALLEDLDFVTWLAQNEQDALL